MPLSRPINYAHSTTSDFFENLIIAQEPIRVVTIDLPEQVIQRQLDRRMLAVAINTGGQKALQTKPASHARCGSTFCTYARFSLKMQRNRRAGRSHVGEHDLR